MVSASISKSLLLVLFGIGGAACASGGDDISQAPTRGSSDASVDGRVANGDSGRPSTSLLDGGASVDAQTTPSTGADAPSAGEPDAGDDASPEVDATDAPTIPDDAPLDAEGGIDVLFPRLWVHVGETGSSFYTQKLVQYSRDQLVDASGPVPRNTWTRFEMNAFRFDLDGNMWRTSGGNSVALLGGPPRRSGSVGRPSLSTSLLCS